MRSVYAILETLANLFESSARMVGKTRVGASVRCRYGQPMTSLDRVIAHCRSRNLDPIDTAVEWL